MKHKLIVVSVAAAIAAWGTSSFARESGIALPYIFGVAPADSVGQATGIDTVGAGLLTVNPDININALNDVGGGITSDTFDQARILFVGNSTVTGFTGTSGQFFNAITAGANATTVNFNGDVFTTTFNVSGTGTVNFNGSLNPAITAANTIFAGDGFINVGANKVFTSAIVTLTDNTGTLTLNGGSSVIGAIGGGGAGLKQINLVGGNAAVTGAVQAQGFSLGINTLNITGALTTNSGGTIATTFVNDATFGKITFTGAQNLNILGPGITVVPTVTGALTNGTTYRIVDASSSTAPAPVFVTNNNPRYTFTGVQSTLGNVDILLTAAPLATLVTAPGALAVAPVLDINAAPGTDLRTIQDAIAILPTTAAINNALAQLAPGNTNLAAPWIASQSTRMFEDHLMARMDEVQNDCCDVACDNNKIPNQANLDRKAHECGDKQHGNWWGKGIGSIGNQEDRRNFDGYETEAVGVMLGYDMPLGNKTLVGLAGGYTNTTIDDNNSIARTKVDSYQVTGYFEYAPQPWFVQAALTAGVNKYDGNRFIRFPGIDRKVNADYRGQQYSALAAIGKHFYVNETVITPLVSLEASRINVGSYTESGGGDASLHVDNQNYDFLQSSLGVKMERVIQTSNGAVSPEVHAKWLHDFNSTTMEQEASFVGGGNSFKTHGIKQDADLYNVGAGFTMLYCHCEGNAWSVKALYDYKWNDSDYSSHQASLIATLNF